MKGLSPLIAAVMLIAISVAIAGLIISSMTAFTKSTQDTAVNRTFTTVDCSGAIIGVEEVFLTNGSTASARAVIKNTGIVDRLEIRDAKLLTINGTGYNATNLPIANFDQGNLETLIFTGMSVPSCNDFSRLVVSTNCPDAEAIFTGRPVC